MSNTDNKNRVETTMSPRQMVGAGVGIVALLILLVVGRNLGGPTEAEILTDAAAPAVSAYDADALDFDPFMAAGDEYDVGQMVLIESELPEPLDEPVLGDVNVVVELTNDTVQSQSDKTVPIVLVFVEDNTDAVTIDGPALVMGRYIGAVEIDTALGATTTAPAVQVDHVDSL